MGWLYLLVIVIVYAVIAAATSNYFERHFAALCKNCSKGAPYTQYMITGYGRREGIAREPGEGHEADGILCGVVWPIMLPFIFTRDLGNAKVKRGKAAIDRYWEDKTAREFHARTAQLERELLSNGPR